MSAYLYITELAKELEELEDELNEWLDGDATPGEEPADVIDVDRLQALRDLKAEMASAWDDILRHGGDGLIPEDEFTDHAEQLAEDIGAIDSRQSDWPTRHIDWDAAAEELKADYYSVSFEGTDYYYREP